MWSAKNFTHSRTLRFFLLLPARYATGSVPPTRPTTPTIIPESKNLVNVDSLGTFIQSNYYNKLTIQLISLPKLITVTVTEANYYYFLKLFVKILEQSKRQNIVKNKLPCS